MVTPAHINAAASLGGSPGGIVLRIDDGQRGITTLELHADAPGYDSVLGSLGRLLHGVIRFRSPSLTISV
jgi:hypothetical protein